MPDRPHIVLMVADSFRGDVLGHLGNPGAQTPHLDALVGQDAISFSQTFAQNPVCTPSRCSFMTGWYPHVQGHRSMRNLLKPWEPNLLSVLLEAGYHLWWGGKNDLLRLDPWKNSPQLTRFQSQPREEGLNAYCKPKPGRADVFETMGFKGILNQGQEGESYWDHDGEMIQAAAQHIRGLKDSEPTCLFLNLLSPHPPYWAKSEFYERIEEEKLPDRMLPGSGEPSILGELRHQYECENLDETTWREIRRLYYAMCLEVDHGVGQIIEALKAQGIYENTWFCFLSDHGDFTGDYSLVEKSHLTLQDVLLRVPLIIKPPESIPLQSGVCDSLVELIDLPSTLLEGIGIQANYSLQGNSLLATLAGAREPVREAVFAEVGARHGEEAFINRQVEELPPDHFYSRQAAAAIPAHREGSYAVMCRTWEAKAVRRPYTGEHEYYDLLEDPGETLNLHGHPGVAESEQAMQSKLLDFFMKTSDVLPMEADPREG